MLTLGYTDTRDAVLEEALWEYMMPNPVGLFVIDADGYIGRVNKRAAEIFGFTNPEEAAGKPLTQLEFFFSQTIIEGINRLLTADVPLRIDRFPGTNMAGHFAYYTLSCNRGVNQRGETVGVFGIIEDVSEEVKRQHELKGRIEELSLLSQISQAVSSALDPEEVIKVILTGVTARQGLGFNRAFLFLLDDESGTLTGRLAIGPVNAEEAGKIWSSLEHDDRSLLEILSLYQEESVRTHRSLTDLIRNMRIDITDGSLFARAIREKAPLVTDRNLELDYETEGILSRLGEKEVAMTPLVLRDRPIGLLLVDNAITHEEITENDRRFLKLIADQTAAAVERSYLYRDIKERAVELEEINRKLAETQNQIIEAEKMSVIGEITSAVTHELRNPLTIIGGFANMVYRNMDNGSPDAEYLNIIISETQRAESVLTDVLDFSKASRTKDRRLDLNQLAQKALEMLKVRLGGGRDRMQLEPHDGDLPVWGNPDQLLHAFYQILLSLTDDLPDETPSLSTYSLSGVSRFDISFAGRSRQNDKVEKTLKQYFGAGNSTKRLSLIVAEETLKYHGGGLSVESHPEKGPVLYVQLPLYKENADGQDSGG